MRRNGTAVTWRDCRPTGCSTRFARTPACRWDRPNRWVGGSSLRTVGARASCGVTSGAISCQPARCRYASTGDTEAKAKADYMVAELARCQERLGGTYLSAFPTTWWERLEKGQRVWAPFYTIHKIMAGMFDMYRLAGNTAGAAGPRGHGRLGRRVDGIEDRRADAADSHNRVRRYRRDAVRPGCSNQQRPLGERQAIGSRRRASSIRSRLAVTSCAACTRTPTSRRRLPPRAATRSRVTCGFTMWPTTSSTRSRPPVRT